MVSCATALLSDAEVTFIEDLRPLQRASESLRKIADVKIVHHYARLAQMVTDTTGSESLRALLFRHSTVLPRFTVRTDGSKAVDIAYL